MAERYALRPGALQWREVEGEIIALGLPSSSYLAVNATGTALWPQLAEGATVDELVGVLVAAFDVDEPTARHDVADFLDDLERQGVIERSEP